MQKSASLSRNNSLRLTAPQSGCHPIFCSQIATGSPTVFPEKRGKVRSLRRGNIGVGDSDDKNAKTEEHRIDIGDEKSDLLGYVVYAGKLVLDKRKASKNGDIDSSTDVTNQDTVNAKLTSKALVWGSHMLSIEDVVSVCSLLLVALSAGIFYHLHVLQ